MKKSLLIALVAICMATPAFADGGIIGMFADQAGTNCSIPHPVGFGYIYLVHLTTTGSNGSGAKATMPVCAGGTLVGDTGQVPIYQSNTGSGYPSQEGFSAGYGNCFVDVPVYVASLSFVPTIVPTGPCCAWAVTADPALGFDTPIHTTCSLVVEEEAAGLTSYIYGPSQTCACDVVPNHESTWGGLKEMFRKGL